MKVTNKGVIITEVPSFAEIHVEPDESSEHGVHIVLAERWNGTLIGHSFGIEEARELRDALSVALDHAEQMSATMSANSVPDPAPDSAAVPFEIGQEINGNEQLPIGTVLTDCDGDRWTVVGANAAGSFNLASGFEEHPSSTISSVATRYRPVTIVSLP